MVHRGIRCLSVVLLATFVAVGCGGSGANDDSDGVGATTTSAEVSGNTEATDTTTVTEPSSNSGTAEGVCELVTTDELAQIFGVPSVMTTVLQGPPDNCIVESDAGAPLAAWSLMTSQASAVFDAFTADPSAIEVDGIGDKAAFVQNTGLLVLKGDSLAVISISGGADLSDEAAMDVAKQIGTFAAGRM